MDFLRIRYSQQVSKLSHGKNYFYRVVRKTGLGLEGSLNLVCVQIQCMHLDNFFSPVSHFNEHRALLSSYLSWPFIL